MRKPIIAGNWKMNLTIKEAIQFVSDVKDKVGREDVESVICAPFTFLKDLKEAVKNIFETIDTGMPMDLISVDLKEALDSLSEITGEISSEDILEHIFGNFCVGK